MSLTILTSNTILYCHHWNECINFYKNTLDFEISFSSHWLVEFIITDNARVSLANEIRTSVKSADGQGITLTWQVENIENALDQLKTSGVETSEIVSHAWGARLFRFYDPEGHRLEIWQAG